MRVQAMWRGRLKRRQLGIVGNPTSGNTTAQGGSHQVQALHFLPESLPCSSLNVACCCRRHPCSSRCFVSLPSLADLLHLTFLSVSTGKRLIDPNAPLERSPIGKPVGSKAAVPHLELSDLSGGHTPSSKDPRGADGWRTGPESPRSLGKQVISTTGGNEHAGAAMEIAEVHLQVGRLYVRLRLPGGGDSGADSGLGGQVRELFRDRKQRTPRGGPNTPQGNTRDSTPMGPADVHAPPQEVRVPAQGLRAPTMQSAVGHPPGGDPVAEIHEVRNLFRERAGKRRKKKQGRGTPESPPHVVTL